jgi:hypothetical protein
MSHIRGRIAVDVQFTDSTTTSGVQSLKTLTLQDATEYTTGKVAIVTGTVGTGVVTIQTSPSQYLDASGENVDFDTDDGFIRRIAFQAVGTRCKLDFQGGDLAYSSGAVSVIDTLGVVSGGDALTITRDTTAGTASYTLVMYGT